MKLPEYKSTFATLVIAGAILLGILVVFWFWQPWRRDITALKFVSTIAGVSGEFGEPFGIAAKGDEIYASDGLNGKILRIANGKTDVFANGFDTPSAIALDKGGNLIVADSGSHTIKSVNSKGEVSTLAGVENHAGFADGDAATAIFNAPVGVAVGDDGTIFVADTYNDRVRVIENGKVTTLAGGDAGFSNGNGANAKFHTPTGLAIWQDKLLVGDTGNRMIRVVESDGRVWTLAGNGDGDLKDGLLLEASFVQPTAVAVDKNGSIFVADGNAIRRISGVIPTVRTISHDARGFADGKSRVAKFNRPSGLAFSSNDDLLVADSDNRLIRRLSDEKSGKVISPEEIMILRPTAEKFRGLQPPRWPFDPPDARRDIAGTLGEIRGEMTDGAASVWFHNGLDIPGAYGETARFIRDEKVLRPIAAENFDTLRELLRMPLLGYIHVRIGRDSAQKPFGDMRFQFQKDANGKLIDVRVPRGTKFKAGEPIGTLNSMNHVHLVAGRSGAEMNALDALIFPGISDTRAPTIEKVTITDENWSEIETAAANSRIKLTGKIRLIARAYDQMDGNSDRRRLGVYQVGYQLLRSDGSPLGDTQWTIKFDRLPDAKAIRFVYADGSKSGATGETIFNYIVTNRIRGDKIKEDFLDPTGLERGDYILRVLVADYFGNTASKDTLFEVVK